MVNKPKRSPAALVLDIVIGLLCVALIGAAAFAATSFYDSFGFDYDADSFYYRLTDGDYSQMVEMYYYNEANGVKADSELRQYYAVAEYFEAASWYKAFDSAGDSARAAEYETKMADAGNDMGALSMVAEDIRQSLGING